jgi:hypothetical protein
MTNASTGAELDRLNQIFYRSNPAAVFVLKLNMLILAASRSIEDLSALLVGSEFEGMRITLAADATFDEYDSEALRSHVTTEAHSIRYHAAECLMRLYMAHAKKGTCPWIELARLPSGPEFNSAVANIHSRATNIDADVAHVFTGNPNVDLDLIRPTERFMRMTAGYLAESRNLHNAVKHGLGIVPGRTGFSFRRDADGAELFGADGPSIVFLEHSRVPPSHVEWRESTQWISLRESVWLTRLTITQIDALWTIAKMHYTGTQPEGVELVTDEGIDLATAGPLAESQSTSKFSRHIGIERRNNARRLRGTNKR